MKLQRLPLLAAGLLAASTASAFINIGTVFVGDAGNADDSTGFGGVSYGYYIGTHEVTNSQYTAFLNSVAATDKHNLYDTLMRDSSRGGITRTGTSGGYSYSVKSGFGDKPVNYVSFWDAARFANWLTNGQPTGAQGNGTTEDGMYNLGGVTEPTNTDVSRQLDFGLGENGVAVASEDEWYKAAYFSGANSGSSLTNTPNDDGYWFYPTQSNTAPTPVAPESATGSNNANYDGVAGGRGTDVGAYTGSASHYGTFDQGGNVWEWSDEIPMDTRDRVERGGSYNDNNVYLQSSFRGSRRPTSQTSFTGFRVSSLAPIPEPSAYAAILGCLGLTLVLMRRKGRV
jgi:formylglycine-generating enzyme required for sulfatase activity